MSTFNNITRENATTAAHTRTTASGECAARARTKWESRRICCSRNIRDRRITRVAKFKKASNGSNNFKKTGYKERYDWSGNKHNLLTDLKEKDGGINHVEHDQIWSCYNLNLKLKTSKETRKMQNPNEDTEWNDILRSKGILPAKPKEKEITEEEIVGIIEQTIQDKQTEKKLSELNLDELDELEDSEDEAILLEYRQKRIAEMKALASKERFGFVQEISAVDYVDQVNKAGDGIWVVLHLYKQGIPLCAMINQYMQELAARFRTVKFLKAIGSTCIPNFPDKNLPSIFVYFEGDLKKQLVGPLEFRGPNLTKDEFEYLIGKTGAIESSIKDDPRPKIKDKMLQDLADTNDWEL